MRKNGVPKRLVLILIGFILVFSTVCINSIIAPTSPPGEPRTTGFTDPGEDFDGDGVDDQYDCAPYDSTKWQLLTGYVDGDGDGYGKGSPVQVCSGAVLPAGYASVGGDCNDANAAIHPGATEVCDGADNDCDGSIDEGFPNQDGDSMADCVDPDDDNDGIPDGSDNCPTTSNPGQTDTDHDGIGDACDTCPHDPQNDVDHDGICGDVDNCPDSYNPDQKDSDNDGIGDTCETPPVVNFTYTPLYPSSEATIQFKDNTTMGGGVLQYWQWNFGDKNLSIEQHPKHKYLNIGVYTVRLNVTDINGKTGTKKRNVTVSTNHPPDTPTIIGETNGAIQTSYTYVIQTTDPDQDNVEYLIDWGDNTNTTTVFYESGAEVIVSHTWNIEGNYSIKVKAIDEHDFESAWATLTVTMPCSYETPKLPFLELLFHRFPNAFPLLRHLMGY